MNKHLNDGQLRAALDGELDAQSLQHLEACALCQSRQRALKSQTEKVANKLSFLIPSKQEHAPSVQASLKRFNERKIQKEIPVLKKLFASPTLRFVSVAVLLLALIVSIPATRALADQVLSLFRVQQVTVLPIDFTGLQELTGNGALGKQVSDLVSSSTNVTKKPGQPIAATDAADASQKSNFSVRLPQNVTASRLTVLGDSAFNFNIDITKAQALLDEAGRTDLKLPTDINGSVISVTVPSSVRADYGSCPDPTAADNSQSGSIGRNYPDCIIFTQIPSPTVSAPANVNVAQLAQIGLEFTGMTSDQAAAFTQSVDWTSTLVVPIPKNAAKYDQLSVDGVTGTLIQRPADDAPQFVLLWVKNGIIYAIGGLGTNSQQAIDMANAMP